MDTKTLARKAEEKELQRTVRAIGSRDFAELGANLPQKAILIAMDLWPTIETAAEAIALPQAGEDVFRKALDIAPRAPRVRVALARRKEARVIADIRQRMERSKHPDVLAALLEDQRPGEFDRFIGQITAADVPLGARTIERWAPRDWKIPGTVTTCLLVWSSAKASEDLLNYRLTAFGEILSRLQGEEWTETLEVIMLYHSWDYDGWMHRILERMTEWNMIGVQQEDLMALAMANTQDIRVKAARLMTLTSPAETYAGRA